MITRLEFCQNTVIKDKLQLVLKRLLVIKIITLNIYKILYLKLLFDIDVRLYNVSPLKTNKAVQFNFYLFCNIVIKYILIMHKD